MKIDVINTVYNPKIFIDYDLNQTLNFIGLSSFLNMCGFVLETRRCLENGVTNLPLNTSAYIHLYNDNNYSIDGTIDNFLKEASDKKLLYNQEYIEKIALIFKKNKVWFHDYNFKNYLYVNKIALDTKKAFTNIKKELIENYEEFDNYYLLFAINYCEMRNFTIDYCLKNENKNISQMLKGFDFLGKNGFLVAYYYMGYINEKIYNERYSLYCYKRFIIETQNSKAYLKVAKIHQKRGENELANDLYLRAYKSNQFDVETCYKYIERLDLHKHDFKVIEKYLLLIERLELYQDNGYLQPNEFQYLIKSYFRVGKISKQIENLNNALIYFEKAKKLYESDKGVEFIKKFYGTESQYFIDCLKNPISIEKVDINIDEVKYYMKTLYKNI